MKLVNFGPRGAEQPGLLVDEEILPLWSILADAGLGRLPTNDLIALWPKLQPLVLASLGSAYRFPADDVRLGPPIPSPRTIVAVGFNYRQHNRDVVGDIPFPQSPILFLKPPSAVAGPKDPIVRPSETTQLDYELELGVVIGSMCHRVSAANALDYVFGYVAANDVTARDVSLGESAVHPLFLQIARGKGAPSFCPLGPWVATPDEVPSPEEIRLRLWVNNVVRQDDRASSMVVGIPALIASVSSSIALFPGDIILTGTPSGCAFQHPGAAYLVQGDIVRGQIAELGEMVNAVIDEVRG